MSNTHSHYGDTAPAAVQDLHKRVSELEGGHQFAIEGIGESPCHAQIAELHAKLDSLATTVANLSAQVQRLVPQGNIAD